ncbi:unnamed protein product [Fraxinus pennsylvanica]|uniref:Uncharacterized protein n=1 Tax=Fraxinus pennsylvanica TaxID=56036 RepID=A0AAD1ZLK1_9LAMI|nr:unnamed protein product [Fraxinus pennsylvanica]
MAPKKRRIDTNDTFATTGVTRRSTRLANTTKRPPSPAFEPDLPKKKKAKTITEQTIEAPPEESEPRAAAVVAEEGWKTIIIEHCKQCNSFKTRAIQVKMGWKKGWWESTWWSTLRSPGGVALKFVQIVGVFSSVCWI